MHNGTCQHCGRINPPHHIVCDCGQLVGFRIASPERGWPWFLFGLACLAVALFAGSLYLLW